VRAGKLLFGAWVDVVWDDRKVEPGTLGRDKSRLDRHILPCWQTVELGAIERDMVQEWVDELTNAKAANGAPKYAPATVHRIYSVFSAIMKTAVLGKKIGVSPCQSIELPVIPPADEYYLEEEEFEDLLACTPGEKNKLFLKIKVRTGMRWGEIVALHRHRVFPKQKRIEVFEAYDNATREIKPYPKGKKKRSVPIDSELSDDLDEWFETVPAMPCTTPHRKIGGRRQHRCKSGLVVPNSKGGVQNYSNFKRDVWTPAITAAELPDVTPHDLRHTYASWVIQSGVSIEVLQKLLGHASVHTTGRYAHLANTSWDAVRAAFGDPLNSVPAPAERALLEQAAENAAPRLHPEDDSAAGAEIIDLFSRRRSTG